MKKSIFFITVFFSFVFFACTDYSNLSMPESISVKQKAKYEAVLGSSSFKIAEKLDVAKLKETLEKDDESSGGDSSDSKAKSVLTVYDYNPNYEQGVRENTDDDVLQYILNYQIEGINLGLTTDSDIKTIDFDTTFTAPDFSDIASANLKLNSSFPVAEPGDKTIDLLTPDTQEPISLNFDITSPNFGTMLIRSGTLDVDVTAPNDVSDDFKMNVSITLKDTNGNEIAKSSGEQDVAHGGTISLDLAGKTLVQNMVFSISGTVSGGTPTIGEVPNITLNAHTYAISAGTSNIVFDTITGLTMDENDLGDKGKLEIKKDFELKGLNGSLKSATINDGSLTFSCSYPDGWSGIVVDNDEFILRGGLELNKDDFTSDNTNVEFILYEEAELKNKEVAPKKVYTYDPEDESQTSFLKFHLDNATIKFADKSAGKKDEITLKGQCEITDLGHITVDISALGKLAEGTNNEIDTGISFDDLLSKTLGSDDEDEEGGGISQLLNNVEFSGITGYLLMTYPEKCSEKLGEISFDGNVKAIYDSGETTLLKQGTFTMKKSEGDKILPDYVHREEEKDDDGNTVYKEWIGKDGAAFLEDTKSAPLTDLDTLLNKHPNNLKLSYTLNLNQAQTEVTLTGEDVDALTKGSSSINISLALVLPLEIVLKDNYDYPETSRDEDGFITIDDVLKLAGTELDKDLLKRDAPDDDSNITKYVEAIKSIKLTYKIKNDTGLTLSAFFRDENVFNGTDSGFEAKELKISNDTQTLEFSRDEIKKIVSSEGWPFMPKIQLKIEESKIDDNGEAIPFTITRGASFDIDAKVSIQTDGTIEVYNKNKD